MNPKVPPRFRPGLEALEDRSLPAHYTLTPVVPTLDAGGVARLAEVIRLGQQQGNRLNVFARVGDSITLSPEFLVPLARPTAGVDLAGDGSLNDTLAFFRSGQIGDQNSFARVSTAAFGGWTAADVLAGLPTELAISKPAFVLVMVGTNDIDRGVSLEAYRQNLAAIAQTALTAGAVPVLSTIPDTLLTERHRQLQPQFNQTIQDVAESLGVPVWNYWRALQRLPQVGISADLVHPSVSRGGGGDLTGTGIEFGYNVRNLTALQTLDKLRRILLLGAPPDLPNAHAGWAPLSNALPVAAGDSTGFQVQVVDPTTRRAIFAFDPFPGFRSSVRVTQADINGDSIPDLIAAVGPGGPPHVKAFDGRDGTLLASFYAFDANLLTGVSVAAADVNGDGQAEIIVSPEANAPAHVKVFTAQGQTLASFYAFAPAFLGGARVAAADANGDGRAEVFVAAGRGGRGHTMVFSGLDFQVLASFYPFGESFDGEVSLAAGDVDGDRRAELAVGIGPGGVPWVTVFRPLDQSPVTGFHVYAPGYLGGVQLAMLERNGRHQLVTASRSAAVADIRLYDAVSAALQDSFVLYEPGFRWGVSLSG